MSFQSLQATAQDPHETHLDWSKKNPYWTPFVKVVVVEVVVVVVLVVLDNSYLTPLLLYDLHTSHVRIRLCCAGSVGL